MQTGKALELHAGCGWSSSRQYRFHAYASPEAGSDFKHFYQTLAPGSSGSRRFTRIKSADSRGLGLWGAVLGLGACF